LKTSADLRPLLDIIKKNKYKVVPSGKHHKVLDPKGRVVTDANGPLIISSTPGDHRARDMHVKRLTDAGVITADQNPWKPKKEKDPDERAEKKGGERLSPDRRAAIVAGIAKRSAANAERTRLIRARLEPFVSQLGGWDKKGNAANLAIVHHHLMKTLNQVGAPPTVNAASQVFYKLKRGETLGEKSAEMMEVLLADLERGGDPIARFMQLQREAKGIAPTARTPAPFPRAADEEQDEPATVHRLPRRHPAEARIPKLALQAAVLLGRIPEGDAGRLEVPTLVEQLAMVEMQAYDAQEGGS
jgi:hypothetical protein